MSQTPGLKLNSPPLASEVAGPMAGRSCCSQLFSGNAFGLGCMLCSNLILGEI